jgi:superfamily II DNA or RNA helicase/DNA modification methylase
MILEMVSSDVKVNVMNTYEDFLAAKSVTATPQGLANVSSLPSEMFPHQCDVTEWALRLGRAAIFLGTGMGKTFIELEWARQVATRSGHDVLILAPLAVAQQIVREGHHFGIPAHYAKDQGEVQGGIVVSNYERIHLFDPDAFGGVVLDESSILKSMDGRTRTELIDKFRRTPYKLAATATPAPNDFTELGNHAEFLGTMTRMEMLSMFFAHDGGSTQDWRLKGHAKKDFWKWVCSWAVFMRKPSDIGHDDSRFILPELRIHEHKVDVDTPTEGMLFAKPAESLQERLAARRSTVSDRVTETARIVATAPNDQWIVWCNLNSESEALANAIPGAVEITGSQDADEKESKILDFIDGNTRVIVTKTSMFGFGLNLQGCHRQIFAGMNDSWESYYQAVRRCWRFGQTNPVDIHLVAASTEGNVMENIKRKEKDAETMANEMTAEVRDLVTASLKATHRTVSTYRVDGTHGEGWEVALSDCVDHARLLASDSVHYSIYSPPFASLYTYSNSDRDMGNSRTHGEFWEHYRFLIAEQFRVIMPGRLVSIHCMNLPTSKVRDGVIGIRDFRGEIIRAFEDAGFIYHSEVCIWKDPVTAMQRTKALGLLHKQIKKDSAMSRQGIPDYLVTMRKPGENEEPVTHTNESFPVQLWQRFASPVWMDINPSDTLQFRSAREHDDERHICPLQLEVIRRGIRLWTNPGDSVWSPFVGIGSEGYVALQEGRTFIGSELKESYWRVACENLRHAVSNTFPLFAQEAPEESESQPFATGKLMGTQD